MGFRFKLVEIVEVQKNEIILKIYCLKISEQNNICYF